MAIPSTPLIAEVIHEGLRRGGIINPTDDDIQDARDNAFQEVKRDIMLVAAEHCQLDTELITPTVIGQREYSMPVTFHSVKSVVILDGPDEWRGTAQTGTSTTMTLAADFDEDENTVLGHDLVTTGGTGSGQRRTVTDYDNDTKIATGHSAWDTTPDSTTTYLLVNTHERLDPMMKHDQYNRIIDIDLASRPVAYAQFQESFHLVPTPDKIYALQIEYSADLDQLNESGTAFLRFMRKYRNVFVQGVSAKTLQSARVDSIKHSKIFQGKIQAELGIYDSLLGALSHEAASIYRVAYRDI